MEYDIRESKSRTILPFFETFLTEFGFNGISVFQGEYQIIIHIAVSVILFLPLDLFFATKHFGTQLISNIQRSLTGICFGFLHDQYCFFIKLLRRKGEVQRFDR